MGLLERLRQADVPEETLEEKTAHDALEKIEDRISQISLQGYFRFNNRISGVISICNCLGLAGSL